MKMLKLILSGSDGCEKNRVTINNHLFQDRMISLKGGGGGRNGDEDII